MEYTRFKTTLKCDGCVAKVAANLDVVVGQGEWKVDLQSPKRELFVPNYIHDQDVVEALAKAGYKAERIV